MTNEREKKRLVGQFLNGIAIAIISTVIVVPVAAGRFDAWLTLAGAVAAILVHGAALALWQLDWNHQEE